MIYSASFIPDEQKLKLSSGDMFDRIINLKINCVNKKTGIREDFVIRSDYEMLYPSSSMPIDGTLYPQLNGQCVIRRCSQKPSIKVQCKMVSSNTGTSIDVYVNNFFMLTQDGKHLRSFNNSEYTIDSVEVVMGYIGQFKDVPRTPAEFFDVQAKYGADKITMTDSIVVTTEKLPPDSMLHIKGYVGEVYASPVAISDITTVEKALANPVASSGKGFEAICYEFITRRYLNKHYFTDEEGKSLEAGKRNIEISKIKDFPVPIKWDKETGLIEEADAKKYGVKVYLSNEAKKLAIPKVLNKNDEWEEASIYFEAGWTIGQTVYRLLTFMEAELDYTFNQSGDVLIYLRSEVTDPQKLYDAFETEGMYKDTVLANPALYDNKLPAVYNINVDAVATIVCPFFTFIEPFQYIEFASRYALTSVVSYLASYAPTIYRFLVISATISFATVDDVNEVHITAVSGRKDKTN